MKITDQQIADWAENPVTLELLDLIDEEIKEILLTPAASCLALGNPQKTQENLIKLDVLAESFATLHMALEGDWSYFEEEEDEV